MTHVEVVPAGERVELRDRERAHVVLEPGDGTGPEGIDHRLAQASVVRRVEHREAAYGPLERGVRRAVVVAQEPVAVEDGALHDGEALPIREHVPHVVEARQRPGVVLVDAERRGDAPAARGRSGTGRP